MIADIAMVLIAVPIAVLLVGTVAYLVYKEIRWPR